MEENKEKRLGEVLLDEGLITEQELQKALAIQTDSGGKLGEILISEEFIRAIDFYRVLSEKLEMEFVSDNFEFYKEMIDEKLVRLFEKETLMQNLFFPLAVDNNNLIVIVLRQDDEKVDQLIEEKTGFVDFKKIIATKRDIQNLVEKTFKKEMIRESISEMYSRHPEESAARVFTIPQIVFFALLSILSIFGAIYYPYQTAVSFFYIINFLFLASILFKFLLSIVGSYYEKHEFISQAEISDIDEKDLPIYSVLVPVYKEPEVIKKLINNLKDLDYPKSKLEVLFLFEENDLETINKAKSVQTPDNWSFIYIPDSQPKTKPKALNYGVKEARGKYVTIYDAEDKPESDQLKKAAAAFNKSDENIICFQSALNYFNRNENLLTKLFTLEYSYWFDYMLPGLNALKLPIPLGGTSNHFRIDKLRELGNWDPFNVTEDADLGIRANARGYRVGILNSTTYEEANKELGNWINQRSRWLKGYLMTFLVHNRHPIKFIKKVGFKGWLTLQLFIGGSVITQLAAPFFWVLFIGWLLDYFSFLTLFYDSFLIKMSLVNLLFGNFLIIYLASIAVFKRNYHELILYVILNPFYYFMQSVAAWKAFFQLFSNPFYWEKTQHGLTSREVSEDD
ncbi:hypothetical protein HSACCH_00308 [Halanaerobium saccharolyticum subsp. saccharolyticum DSM 6643]|uniref:Type II secretion system protein GspE N-terminal domain-containing protein n=1 Tax=Halanaerobium saccharolyticum subsp. saccharolyticum DSM 6643 TaxID=1293054 RepID=M5DYC8_9FIRM|nr:glycosyltransferase [Halanaerobium saccharolyticum]CCU77971.1 hypothetical protein HSACCH_00308 [Halanaerobium saccharolyticum subsp. saccharolyticum DSM 6643]